MFKDSWHQADVDHIVSNPLLSDLYVLLENQGIDT